jgi:hypothetical protein
MSHPTARLDRWVITPGCGEVFCSEIGCLRILVLSAYVINRSYVPYEAVYLAPDSGLVHL